MSNQSVEQKAEEILFKYWLEYINKEGLGNNITIEDMREETGLSFFIPAMIEFAHLSQVSNKWISVEEVRRKIQAIYSEFAELNRSRYYPHELRRIIELEIEQGHNPINIFKHKNSLPSPPIEGETISQTTADEEISLKDRIISHLLDMFKDAHETPQMPFIQEVAQKIIDEPNLMRDRLSNAATQNKNQPSQSFD